MPRAAPPGIAGGPGSTESKEPTGAAYAKSQQAYAAAQEASIHSQEKIAQTTPPGGGGGGSGGGSGGSGGSGGNGGGGGTLSTLEADARGLFAKPTWWAGLWPPNKAASTVRNGWFALLGDLNGYPFNANLFYSAYAILFFQSADQNIPVVPLPIQVTITLLDSSGNTAGTFSGSATTPSLLLGINGTYNLTDVYTIQVDYTFQGSPTPYTAQFGPFSGSVLASQASAIGLTLQVNDFPAINGGGVTVLNSDGSPAVGVSVGVGLFYQPPAGSTVPAYQVNPQGISLVTDSDGQIFFSSPVTQTANLVVLTSGQSVAEVPASSAALAAGTFAYTFTLLPPGQTQNAGKILVDFTHGSGLNASPVEYALKITTEPGGGESTVAATVEGDNPHSVRVPRDLTPFDTITFELTGTWNGETEKSTTIVSGSTFANSGVTLNIDFPGGNPPPHKGKS